MLFSRRMDAIILIAVSAALVWPVKAMADDESNRNILKQGLLGAGVGAISSSASGGNAGKGALIGAGANVIGGALLDTLTGPSQPRQQPVQQVQYVQAAPAPMYVQQQQPVYAQQQPMYAQPAEAQQVYYEEEVPDYEQPQEDPNKKILKQGLLGAGVGAISAGASGGNAGKGALIGAGTNVIGGALLDTLTTPSQPQRPRVRRVYVQPAPVAQRQVQPQYQPGVNVAPAAAATQPKKKIIRKYNSDGKIVSEEEVWE
ncbi:MAG: hypothetical protein WCG06_05110 [Candidatus Omnitrophota bacterium]